MELYEAIGSRAMVRSFRTDPVDRTVLERILMAALRAPTAGNTGGTAWIVLSGNDQTAAYWDATTDAPWREASDRFEGMRRAPVVLLSYASAEAYVERYGEPDKAAVSDLGAGVERWPVPYWTGDAAFGVMTVLLAAVDAGLGACILGAFKGEDVLATQLRVPPEWRLFGAVLLGYHDGQDRPSRSLDRSGPSAADRIHWGAWT
jgi:nitroreductase